MVSPTGPLQAPVISESQSMSSRAASPYKYYDKASGHELLKNAKVLKSDHFWARAMASIWRVIINAGFFNIRVLSLTSIFKKGHQEYKNELDTIAKLPEAEKIKIRNNTHSLGGETEESYLQLEQQFASREQKPNKNPSIPDFFWHAKSDSLNAAREFQKMYPDTVIAITNFANAVRVGGSDSVGGKGSQEENLFRNTYLRVSLEQAERTSNQETRSKTGRYIPYYGAIVSKDVPTFKSTQEQPEHFGFVSIAAPDLRTGVHAEGNYLAAQKDPILTKEILYRKLSVVMMSAAITGFDVLELGAFGCGAFKNDPNMVAEVLNGLIHEDRFAKVFSHIIMPIGTEDRNRKPFEQRLPASKRSKEENKESE